ncbi:hypothetical protein HID58_010394 [Brassica napus]|uniref:Uncharacterized protein n=2 Tax=Brassica napus TaxID=3708 RepID=A0ABQ8CX77_BRANA|nr:hypothetical protein HID58_021667 [Brassica napus]KAH0933277.1 hypothetical protein HID58_010394 [Brassica napus]
MGWEANEYSLKLIQMMKLTLADNSFRPISKTSSHVKKEEEEELIGRVVADKVGEIRRELERQCGVCASAKAWDEENKEVRVGRREQNPQAIFSGDRQTDTKPKEGTYDLVATRDISLQNKFHTKEMESIEITTLEDENEIKIILAESKERKPARKWWSY